MGAYSIKVRGVVQGVGFRPFVYRLAQTRRLTGWVLNGDSGVEIHLEGPEESLQLFLNELESRSPAAARVTAVQVSSVEPAGFRDFAIRESESRAQPTARVSPDLPVCEDCLRELLDPRDRRFGYPYINCTNCGPRYSVIENLPYDRANTTMSAWGLDDDCSAQYRDPANRRFHAQPVACPRCGPYYFLSSTGEVISGDEAAIRRAAQLLSEGKILAIKGLGGYHLACDARNAEAVASLRTRKFRKEKPFALMARDIDVARNVVTLGTEAEELLRSPARPIVLAPARLDFPGVAPGNDELGVMLPYAPIHFLLFAAGALEVLVMTSANRSSEPIAYRDEEAKERLDEIADAFLVGERPIARRVEDSVLRVGAFGAAFLRRSRGYAPGAVATIPAERPILALGADLKNTIALVLDGQAFVSQHIGDLEHYEAHRALAETVEDLLSMYKVPLDDLLVVHDAHPQYFSTVYALKLPARSVQAVQHHRAHIASAIAERGAWGREVIGVSFDGAGYGDDGSIWGGEIFAGSVRGGFERVAHLRAVALPGGDAAASFPVQAAAGFLCQLDNVPDLSAPPFSFPLRYFDSVNLLQKGVRLFPTTSMGRLFDTAAALLGFARATTFEGQSAIWLEQLARKSPRLAPYPFLFERGELDFRPLLEAIIHDRVRGRNPAEIAQSFHQGIACGLTNALLDLCGRRAVKTVVLSGGVFQNEQLLAALKGLLEPQGFEIWTNLAVPCNDGGISLGQAALGAFQDMGRGLCPI